MIAHLVAPGRRDEGDEAPDEGQGLEAKRRRPIRPGPRQGELDEAVFAPTDAIDAQRWTEHVATELGAETFQTPRPRVVVSR